MQAWIERLAETLGEEPLSEDATTRILEASREVAHRVERKTTPLAAFLVGSAVGRSLERGGDRSEALGAVLADLEHLLPSPEGSSSAKG